MEVTLQECLSNRVLLLDGAMGSLVQQSVPEYKGLPDILTVERPEVIRDIHRQYLEAGADIITTCTFNAQRLSLKDAAVYREGLVRDINLAAARLAREVADEYARESGRPRFVLGDVGPTAKMLSLSPDISLPSFRDLAFNQLKDIYREQIEALAEGGVDAILLETCTDVLNIKAAIAAMENISLPLMISMTVSDASGRILSGQTIEAFVETVMYAHPLSIGLNCGFGADKILPWLRDMAKAVDGRCLLTCHPNAGLPNAYGGYDDTPDDMVRMMRPMLEEGLVRVIGGCCGTTPDHIRAMGRLRDEYKCLSLQESSSESVSCYAGLDILRLSLDTFCNVGERCNVAGSRKFLRLISERNYDEAVAIARKQVEDGAMMLDINMDDGLLDAAEEMQTFLRLIAAEPDIARVPVMVDSSHFEVIAGALQNIQGKPVVNSISLKQGEEEFLREARYIRNMGAAAVVMLFDEKGQATDYERRIEIAARAYRLIVEEAGFAPEDIIFDPNVLTVATGMPEHNNYALDFLRAVEWIHLHMPACRISGGISNLSFALRGQNYMREAMHAVFLYHAVHRGLNMAIMNPSASVTYESVDKGLRTAIEDVIFNRRSDATERLLALVPDCAAAGTNSETSVQGSSACTPVDVVKSCLSRGRNEGLEEALQQLLNEGRSALDIISGPLMDGMMTVGRLFGEGKMFLPQVVKTARTMKQACAFLEPYINGDGSEAAKAGKILIATVKGDVHDIGKNIVKVVLQCNGFHVIDLGVMVQAETIVRTAIDEHVDIVCLSGLITPSLDEMCNVAEAMERAGLRVPLFVGGATTSEEHTRIKIAPLYSGGVYHMKDATENPIMARKLLQPKRVAPFMGERRHEPLSVAALVPLIDWRYFYHAWMVKNGSVEAEELRRDALDLLASYADAGFGVEAVQMFCKARGEDDGIRLFIDASREVMIPTPRQREGEHLSLCDFVDRDDVVGAFAVTINDSFIQTLENLKKEDDDPYKCLLLQTLGDRLAEAAAECLAQELHVAGWGGIRPAVGYPVLPDQHTIFLLDKVLNMAGIGIRLTENGAMYPQSSVAGFYIGHPNAKYFDAR
ncbi:MAG: methionine synthase [Bacteroidaceae bacterium]|nr:methionine synthase [Bacteroidaceae bacterium]